MYDLQQIDLLSVVAAPEIVVMRPMFPPQMLLPFITPAVFTAPGIIRQS